MPPTMPVPGTPTHAVRAEREERNRRAQDLLKQIDAKRLDRSPKSREENWFRASA